MDDYPISIAELAKAIGCNKSAIRRWKLNNYLPEPNTLIKLTRFFNTSSDYFFGLSENKNITNQKAYNSFYERYTILRQQKNVTDYKVAKYCQIGSGTISKWKKIKKLPETETLLKLAYYFDCSLDYLLDI